MLNTLDETLKFLMEIGGNSICFLDLKISAQNNRLERNVYSKSTDSHLYLEASFCHNKSSKNGIIKGVALRLRIICSTMKDFKIKSGARGLSAKLMKSEFGKVSSIPSYEACRKVEKYFENKAIFTSTFNPRGPNVSQIINRHLH